MSTSTTPLFTGAPVTAGSITFTPEILSLHGGLQVRAIGGDGAELVIPAEFLPALASRATNLKVLLDRTLDESRYQAHNPTQRHDLAKAGANGTGKTLTAPGADVNADGAPFLHWSPRAGVHGWSLGLTGAPKAALGWAAWDNIDGTDNLVAMLTDPDACIAIASMVSPDEVAQMSARTSARALRSARALPGIDAARVRKLLTAAGISGRGASDYDLARVRALTISSGGKNVPVAVAVSAPSSPAGARRPTEEETAGLNWKAKYDLAERYNAEARVPFLASVRDALTAAGWRILDLPNPVSNYRSDGNKAVVWATRIDAQTWSSISAAAQEAARNLSMGRGGSF